MSDNKKELIESWNKLEKILHFVYEKYKHNFSQEEQELCTDLISNREYGEGFENLIAILKNRNLSLDEDSRVKLKEAASLMEIPFN
jgi:translation initiation factor 2 alpha subunit (eIF-2alpha)